VNSLCRPRASHRQYSTIAYWAQQQAGVGRHPCALYSDRTVREILSSDAQAFFRELGLEQHLTPQRSNGVRAMIERIRADAAAA